MSRRHTVVKICGVCTPEDALAAADAGAEAVGVVLAGGPRHLDLREAADVLAPLPPDVTRVGVFVDPAAEEVAEAVRVLGLHRVQLHGSESPDFCEDMPVPVVKAFRVGEGLDASAVEPYRHVVAAVLLDTLVPGLRGGTGVAFDWTLIRDLDAPPIVLAGGLTPGNVGEAVRAVRPFGVDVSSGVESGSRRKDPALMAQFVAAVRAADEEM